MVLTLNERFRFLAHSLVLLSVLVSGCTKPNKSLTISAFVPGSDSHKAAMAIKKVLADDGWDFTIISQSHKEGIEALRNGGVDLAITSNDISNDPTGIRSLVPLYREVLISLINENSPLLHTNNLEESINVLKSNEVKVVFSEENSYSHLFAKRILTNIGITDSLYESYYFPEKSNYDNGKLEMVKSLNPDIIYIVGNVDNEIIDKLMANGYSFKNNMNHIDHLDASYYSSLSVKKFRSFPVVVPAYSTSPSQKQAVVAYGLFSSLLSNKNLDDGLVYDLLSDLMRAQPELIRYNANFFDMSESFDLRYLNYQTHQGATDYFERNKPGFFERYAELGGVIFSMSVVIIGFLITLNKIVSQRKKDRIDVYYLAVMETRKNLNYKEALDKLTELEEKALNQMVEEKLAADSSYIVFLQMLNRTRVELEAKQNLS